MTADCNGDGAAPLYGIYQGCDRCPGLLCQCGRTGLKEEDELISGAVVIPHPDLLLVPHEWLPELEPCRLGERFRDELCTLSRDYRVAISVLNEAIKSRTQQFYRDRAALLEKYSAVLEPGDVPGDVPGTAYGQASRLPKSDAATALPRSRRTGKSENHSRL